MNEAGTRAARIFVIRRCAHARGLDRTPCAQCPHDLSFDQGNRVDVSPKSCDDRVALISGFGRSAIDHPSRRCGSRSGKVGAIGLMGLLWSRGPGFHALGRLAGAWAASGHLRNRNMPKRSCRGPPGKVRRILDIGFGRFHHMGPKSPLPFSLMASDAWRDGQHRPRWTSRRTTGSAPAQRRPAVALAPIVILRCRYPSRSDMICGRDGSCPARWTWCPI